MARSHPSLAIAALMLALISAASSTPLVGTTAKPSKSDGSDGLDTWKGILWHGWMNAVHGYLASTSLKAVSVVKPSTRHRCDRSGIRATAEGASITPIQSCTFSNR